MAIKTCHMFTEDHLPVVKGVVGLGVVVSEIGVVVSEIIVESVC